MIWIYGVLFLFAVLKWNGTEWLANISWWWILGPLIAVVVWFEVLERLFGFDVKRKVADAEFERAKRERIRKQLERPGVRR
ncbi:MAG TPA: TIGR04438 family Trp-rich protein [Burkholderiaceae bacterium]|nr:TIGR04438 family Trp-rich protein [Burkholderiaceae bacterium]